MVPYRFAKQSVTGFFNTKNHSNRLKLNILGDIGEWQPDGSMKIIDRKKNIFKLSQGEYVAVENLENIFSYVPTIDMVILFGDHKQHYSLYIDLAVLYIVPSRFPN